MLVVYPRTNKQNQKKKRKVEPPTPQVGWVSCPLVELGLGRSKGKRMGKILARTEVVIPCMPPLPSCLYSRSHRPDTILSESLSRIVCLECSGLSSGGFRPAGKY